MRRGEVWWVEFDPAVGSVLRKTRPAVIVSNDAANRNLARVVVVPLTSNTGRQYPGEALVTVVGKQGKAMADQIMAAEKGRLKSRVDVLSQDGHVGDRGCHLDSFGHAEMIRRSEIAARAG